MLPRRILVLAEGQLGDLLLLTPALRALKQSFPEAVLGVCVVQRRSYLPGVASNLPLMTENPPEGTAEAIAPFADEVVEVFRPALRQGRGLQRLRAEVTILRRIRKGKYDTVISCFPEDRFAVWAFLSGARQRVGAKRQPLAALYTVRPAIEKEEGGVLRYYAALAGAAGATVRSRATEFHVSEEEGENAGRRLAAEGISPTERFAVIHPGASGPYRVWPPERFAHVAGVLSAEYGVRPVLCGTAHDQRVLDAVRSHLRSNSPQMVLTSVRALAALLSRASLCLSNDSGPRHLAIAVGTPSVAILPKHNDRAWGVYDDGRAASFVIASGTCPLCPPERCLDRHQEGEEFGSACIRMVTVEDVLERIRRALSPS